MEEMVYTSQYFRTTERLAATPLSGGQAPEVSFTTSMANLVAGYTVDPQLNSLSCTAAGSVVLSSEDIGCLLRPLLKTDRILSKTACRSVSREDMVR